MTHPYIQIVYFFQCPSGLNENANRNRFPTALLPLGGIYEQLEEGIHSLFPTSQTRKKNKNSDPSFRTGSMVCFESCLRFLISSSRSYEGSSAVRKDGTTPGLVRSPTYRRFALNLRFRFLVASITLPLTSPCLG